MIVSLNGQRRDLPEDATVESVATLMAVAPDARGVAVALEGEVIPRAQWSRTPLSEGAHVEIVNAVQGG
jgi:sulfur carrier protein